MAKDKNIETKYKEEGKRRMAERKKERKKKYLLLIEKANDLGVHSLAACKHNAPWKCSRSPTGLRQICSYEGTCEYPCNGDC